MIDGCKTINTSQCIIDGESKSFVFQLSDGEAQRLYNLVSHKTGVSITFHHYETKIFTDSVRNEYYPMTYGNEVVSWRLYVWERL